MTSILDGEVTLKVIELRERITAHETKRDQARRSACLAKALHGETEKSSWPLVARKPASRSRSRPKSATKACVWSNFQALQLLEIWTHVLLNRRIVFTSS